MVEAPGTAPGSSPLITQPFIAIVRLPGPPLYRRYLLIFEGASKPCNLLWTLGSAKRNLQIAQGRAR